MAQLVKNLPAMQETWVQSLGWEDPLEKEQLPTPVFWPTEFHGWYSPWGLKESETTEQLSLSLSIVDLDMGTILLNCTIYTKSSPGSAAYTADKDTK